MYISKAIKSTFPKGFTLVYDLEIQRNPNHR